MAFVKPSPDLPPATGELALEPPDESLRAAIMGALEASGVATEQRSEILRKIKARYGKLGVAAPTFFAMQMLASELENVTGDANIGLRLGAAMPKGASGVLEYVLYTAPSIRAACALYNRFSPLMDDFMQLVLREEGGYGVLELHAGPGYKVGKQLEDWRFARIVVGARRAFAEPEFCPSGIDFSYDKPSDLTCYRELLGARTTFSFREPFPAVRFLASDLDRPFASTDSGLHRILRHSTEQLLRVLPSPTSVVQKVRRALLERLHLGRPVASEVAAKMGLSERTLRRLLSGEGTTFSGVLNELRAELFGDVSEEDNPKAVATQLGFQDPRSMRRAARRFRSGS